MRTTIVLDEDVLRRIKQILKKDGKTMKEVINSSLRRAFALDARQPEAPYSVETFSSEFNPGIDTLDLNSLVDELAIEDFKSKAKKKSKT